MTCRLLAVAVALLLAAPATAPAQLDRLLKGLGTGPGSALPDARIGEGLREALQVGTENTVSLTGRLDGYLANQAIRILMPERLRAFAGGLRAVGYGPQVDEFTVSMNRAAERAAPFARQIFLDAIGEMSFEDARRILAGPDDAATEYLRGKATDRLTAAFHPVVGRAMDEVGVTRQYRALAGRFEQIPFVTTEAFDLDRYVTDKALGGLFHVLAEQERQIRTNPAARVTDVLRQVFSR